ncbi:hypothetical protein BaRGS_00025559 [Batillaria attramentaria]|uniref:Uncharacterized protein n=1 Tax=Batillaria attramentaria TaxID=370345 RepID=A0ABD0K6X9_9CAEN
MKEIATFVAADTTINTNPSGRNLVKKSRFKNETVSSNSTQSERTLLRKNTGGDERVNLMSRGLSQCVNQPLRLTKPPTRGDQTQRCQTPHIATSGVLDNVCSESQRVSDRA